MSDTKDFPTASVLSTVTGRLVSTDGISAVYEVLNWMTGESVYTHQIPRISREAKSVLLSAHPDLATACTEAELVTPENWRDWLAIWEERYGVTLSVPKFAKGTPREDRPFVRIGRNGRSIADHSGENMTGSVTLAADCRTLSFRVADMIEADELRGVPQNTLCRLRLLQMDLAALADRIADQAAPVERGRVGWWRRWFRMTYR